VELLERHRRQANMTIAVSTLYQYSIKTTNNVLSFSIQLWDGEGI
jgi:hypothetical protein